MEVQPAAADVARPPPPREPAPASASPAAPPTTATPTTSVPTRANGAAVPIAFPGGARGIGFDDMRYDPGDGVVLVPAGMTGRVFALRASTLGVEAYEGFAHGGVTTGHGDGATSVDVAPGILLVADRTSRTVDLVDRSTRAIVAHVALAAPPDYVRYVAATQEVWVTEPRARQIEVFDLAPFLTRRADPTRKGMIAVPGGPESLELDEARGLAFTNVWTGARTLAIALGTRAVQSNWPSGCTHDDTQGLALDRARGVLFVGCGNGAITALDLAHGGRILGRVAVGAEVDIIAYNATLHHVYAPSERDGRLYIVGMDAAGALGNLGAVDVSPGTHCATTDGVRTAFVCDPEHGAVVAVDDPFPPS